MIPLIIDLETEWRGGQNQALLLLKGLYERGHAAELVAAKGSSLGHRALKANICVHHVSRGMLKVSAAAKIWSTLREGRIELVHANEAHAVTAAWLAGAAAKLPFVISRRVGYPLGKKLDCAGKISRGKLHHRKFPVGCRSGGRVGRTTRKVAHSV